MPVYLVSLILITFEGALLMVYLDPSIPTARIYGLTMPICFGTGTTMQIGDGVGSLAVPAQNLGDAVSYKASLKSAGASWRRLLLDKYSSLQL